MTKQNMKKNKGFTLVELVVAVAIFAFMTALLLAKYGTFNQSVLLTNLAYDIALVIRNAQSYGLNVKSVPVVNGTNYSNDFSKPYGVRLSISTTGTPAANTQVLLFADLNQNERYDTGETISTYYLKRGNTISVLCGGPTGLCNNSLTSVDIVFKRPDPNAIMTGRNLINHEVPNLTYLEIHIKPTSGAVKKIRINPTGLIYIFN